MHYQTPVHVRRNSQGAIFYFNLTSTLNFLQENDIWLMVDAPHADVGAVNRPHKAMVKCTWNQTCIQSRIYVGHKAHPADYKLKKGSVNVCVSGRSTMAAVGEVCLER